MSGHMCFEFRVPPIDLDSNFKRYFGLSASQMNAGVCMRTKDWAVALCIVWPGARRKQWIGTGCVE
jgi:hypothetical protein